jgi:hypothetical protein
MGVGLSYIFFHVFSMQITGQIPHSAPHGDQRIRNGVGLITGQDQAEKANKIRIQSEDPPPAWLRKQKLVPDQLVTNTRPGVSKGLPF